MVKARALYAGASEFKTVLESLSKLVDEACVKFERGGLKLRALDPANVALIEVVYPSSAFIEYEIEEEGTWGLNVAAVLRALGRIRRGDQLKIEVSDDSVILEVPSAPKRRYEARNLEVPEPEVPEARLALRTKVALLADHLRSILKDLEVVGERATIEYKSSEDALVIYAPGETKYVSKLSRSSGAILELESEGDSSSTYDIDYLLSTLNLSRVSDAVTIEFSSNMPLKMTFRLAGGGNVSYLLAPLV
ncbi:MAG: DNA polymerase sliding clamp [Fervidicoccaceae archaeon]